MQGLFHSLAMRGRAKQPSLRPLRIPWPADNPLTPNAADVEQAPATGVGTAETRGAPAAVDGPSAPRFNGGAEMRGPSASEAAGRASPQHLSDAPYSLRAEFPAAAVLVRASEPNRPAVMRWTAAGSAMRMDERSPATSAPVRRAEKTAETQAAESLAAHPSTLRLGMGIGPNQPVAPPPVGGLRATERTDLPWPSKARRSRAETPSAPAALLPAGNLPESAAGGDSEGSTVEAEAARPGVFTTALRRTPTRSESSGGALPGAARTPETEFVRAAPAPFQVPDLALRAERRARRDERPIVRVTIDRIDLRAAAPPPAPRPKTTLREPRLTLQGYLKRRSEPRS